MELNDLRENYGLFYLAMNPTYGYTHFQQEILGPVLDAIVNDDPAYQRTMVFAPFRHGKSNYCTLDFIPYYMGHHPDRNVILLSYGKKLARAFGRQIRDKMRSELFKALFPDAVIQQGSRAADEFTTECGGKFYASGFDGTVNGIGAGLLCIDDPAKNRSEVLSETVQDFHHDLYNSVVRTRLEPQASILMTTSRFAPTDLPGWRIQEDGAFDHFTGKPYEDAPRAVA